MKICRWFTIVVLSACAAPLWAQVATHITPASAATAQKPVTFGEADRDHDGRLKRSEIPREFVLLRARFNEFDTNHDGYLEPSEIVAYLATSGAGRRLDVRRLGVATPNLQHPLELQSGHGIEQD